VTPLQKTTVNNALRMRGWLSLLSIRDAGTDRRILAQSRSVPPAWKAPIDQESDDVTAPPPYHFPSRHFQTAGASQKVARNGLGKAVFPNTGYILKC